MYEERRQRASAGRAGARFALLLAVAAIAVSGAGSIAAAPASIGAAFFGMSAIRTTPLHGMLGTRFGVTVDHVPADNHPAFRWDLTLARSAESGPSASIPVSCQNRKLPGGRPVGPSELSWANQGATFVWYGSGTASCRATVSVEAENEYEHCTASIAVPAASPESGAGGPAVCALGGFSLSASSLPVPSALLQSYKTAGARLTRLIGELRAGKLPPGELDALVAPILSAQNTSFSTLFPPVFGCKFATLFDPLTLSESTFDEQVAQLEGGRAVSSSSLSTDATYLQTAARGLTACERSAANPGGAAPAVVQAVAKLSTEARALARGSSVSARGRLLLGKLEALQGSLRLTLRGSFPSVFGISFDDLVSRVAEVNSALARAELSAQVRDARGAAAALASAVEPEQTIDRALVRHQRHVIEVENANG